MYELSLLLCGLAVVGVWEALMEARDRKRRRVQRIMDRINGDADRTA